MPQMSWPNMTPASRPGHRHAVSAKRYSFLQWSTHRRTGRWQGRWGPTQRPPPPAVSCAWRRPRTRRRFGSPAWRMRPPGWQSPTIQTGCPGVRVQENSRAENVRHSSQHPIDSEGCSQPGLRYSWHASGSCYELIGGCQTCGVKPASRGNACAARQPKSCSSRIDSAAKAHAMLEMLCRGQQGLSCSKTQPHCKRYLQDMLTNAQVNSMYLVTSPALDVLRRTQASRHAESVCEDRGVPCAGVSIPGRQRCARSRA